ncbi:MAG: hypothetical protein KJP04_03500 [Arenicella sp.]|nr:hypothetical protein [Arenicella sp.]
MRTTMVIILFAANLLPSMVMAESDYVVQINADQPRRAQVTASIEPGQHGLCFIRSAEDTGLTHGWTTFIHKLSVTDPDGRSVNAAYDGEGCWRLNSTGRVTVSYTMLLLHDKFPNMPGDDELAYAGDWGQFWTGRALFIEGKPSAAVTVEFLLPPDWAVTAPWPSAGNTGLIFAPTDTDAVFDSGLMLGKHESLKFSRGNAVIHMGFNGAGPRARRAELREIFDRSLGSFTDLHAAPTVGDLAVFLGKGRVLGGGVIGNTISMLVVDEVPDTLMPMLAYIVIHEVFHLWNANLNYANQEDMYWFTEGFAEYFSHFELLQQGILEGKTLLGRFEERAGKYAAAAGQLSMAEAGQKKLDHYNLIYSGGMMATLALDMHILKTSNGRHRMADVMPALYTRFGVETEVPLDLDTFAAVIEEQTGVDCSGILRRYVTGTEVLITAPLMEQLAGTL